MKTRNVSFVFPLLLCFASCEYHEIVRSIDSYKYHSDSFFPMTVGNYWRANEYNQITITDTIMAFGVVFYEVQTLIGGDVLVQEYLRIDEENNLVKKFSSPTGTYLVAKFNASPGDTFFTLNNASNSDLKVTTVTKREDFIEFRYEQVYNDHPILSGADYKRAYKKGLGPVEKWREVRIDGVVYRYD